jgi:hypothetical protein
MFIAFMPEWFAKEIDWQVSSLNLLLQEIDMSDNVRLKKFFNF